jgi:hypothetical protein
MSGMRWRALSLCAAAAGAMVPAGRGAAQSPAAVAVGPRGALVGVLVSPETVTVGTPFTVRLRVRAPKIATIRFPPVPDSGDAIEPIDPRAIEENADTAVIDRTAVYRLVAWDVGLRTPRLGGVTVAAAGGEQRYTVAVPPVVVLSMLPADSAERVPRPARDPVPLPSGWWRWVLLGAIALAGGLWYWFRRRRSAALGPPLPDAFAAATDAFAAIDALGLVEAGETGRFLIAQVDVMRAYIARRFPSAGRSLTASQFLAAIDASDFPVLPARLLPLLDRDAAVRFAGAPLAAADARAQGGEARAIVGDVEQAYLARLRAEDRGPTPRKRR